MKGINKLLSNSHIDCLLFICPGYCVEIIGKSRSEIANLAFNLVRKVTYTYNSITRQFKIDTNSVILRIRWGGTALNKWGNWAFSDG